MRGFAKIVTRVSAGHLTALLGTAATCLSTSLTMVVFVLSAFGCARTADICTYAAKLFDELRPTAHELDRHRAGKRAVVIQADARGRVRNVRFAKAGLRTVFAFLNTLMTGVDARFVAIGDSWLPPSGNERFGRENGIAKHIPNRCIWRSFAKNT